MCVIDRLKLRHIRRSNHGRCELHHELAGALRRNIEKHRAVQAFHLILIIRGPAPLEVAAYAAQSQERTMVTAIPEEHSIAVSFRGDAARHVFRQSTPVTEADRQTARPALQIRDTHPLQQHHIQIAAPFLRRSIERIGELLHFIPDPSSSKTVVITGRPLSRCCPFHVRVMPFAMSPKSNQNWK